MKNEIVILLFILLFSSCSDTQEVEQNKNVVKKNIDEVIKKTDFSIYDLTDSLLENQFGVVVKHIDFFYNSKRRPYNLGFYDTTGLIKVRGYIIPNFDKPYISKNKENYLFFIYEYQTEMFSKKSMKRLEKDNYLIQNRIKKGVFFNQKNTVDSDLERIRMISAYCKYGGLIFAKNKYIISVVETCRKPFTIKKLKWSDYELIILNTYLKEGNDSLLILKAECGDRYFKEKFYKK